jgi:hypothetical protein
MNQLGLVIRAYSWLTKKETSISKQEPIQVAFKTGNPGKQEHTGGLLSRNRESW